MATNTNLGIKFTEDKYATKAEVAKEMKTSFVDMFWPKVQEYRSQFNRYLSIKTIEKNMIVFCPCQSVNAEIGYTENKLVKLNRQTATLNIRNGDYDKFKRICLVKCLKYIARDHDLGVSEETITNIANGKDVEINNSNAILVRYLDALKYIENRYVNNINEEYVAELYEKMLGTENLTMFYRNAEDRSKENRVLIDRVYTSAPVQLIEPMMESLYDFISSSSISPTVKAATAYYYIVYIKPFNYYSDEMAILVAKSIIAKYSIEELGAYVPLETLLYEERETLAKIAVEVQKTSDITYIVNYVLKTLQNKCDELMDEIVKLNSSDMRKDYFEESIVTEPVTYTSNEETKQETQYTQPTPVVEKPVEQPQIQIVYEQPKQEVKEEVKVVEQKIEEVEKPQPVKVKYVQQELAVSYIPPALDEKEASRLEQHLLESDPELKKGEAKFFARHCIKGMKYTIQQYKKSIGCVYETARTSMEHLVELGYYKKEMVKNKFVYVPIPR